MDEKFSQRKANIQTEFEFSEESLFYTYTTRTSHERVEIPYTSITGNVRIFSQENEWLRNVGYIWGALGIVLEIIPMIQSQTYHLPFWTLVGVTCLGFYFYGRVKLSSIDAGPYNIHIIQDGAHDHILNTVQEKRANYIRNHFGVVNLDNDPEAERQKFKYLKKENIINQKEFDSALETIEKHQKSIPVRSPLLP